MVSYWEYEWQVNLSYLKVKTFYMLLSGSNYKLREFLGREFAEDAEQLMDYLYIHLWGLWHHAVTYRGFWIYKILRVCQFCEYNFQNPEGLTTHACGQSKCEICGYLFSCKSNLKRHTQDTCNVEKKVFVMSCDCCETTFIRKSDLRRLRQKRENQDVSAKWKTILFYSSLL